MRRSIVSECDTSSLDTFDMDAGLRLISLAETKSFHTNILIELIGIVYKQNVRILELRKRLDNATISKTQSNEQTGCGTDRTDDQP